jgi:hypothetical protein
MLHVGKDIEGAPHKRLVTVHDGVDFKQVELSAKRLDELTKFFEPAIDKVLGDGSDVIPGYHATAADANEALSFVIGETTYTEAKPFSRLYKPMQFRGIMPVSNEVGPWADSIRYELDDGVGIADWGSDKGDDFPYVDVQYDQVTRTVAHGRIGYFYTLQELRQTAYLRRPLNERRLAKAQQAAERALNKAAIWGIPSKGLTGLLNQTAVPQVAVGGTGGGTALTGNWDTSATPDQVLADLNWGLNYVFTAMGFNYVADSIGIPVGAWNRLVSTARSTYSDTTIWRFLLTNNFSKATMEKDIKIFPLFGSDTAGAATTGATPSGRNSRALFYINDADMLTFHVPMPVLFQAPQLVNLRVNIPGEQRCGGLEVRFHNSMLYMDKVLSTG